MRDLAEKQLIRNLFPLNSYCHGLMPLIPILALVTTDLCWCSFLFYHHSSPIFTTCKGPHTGNYSSDSSIDLDTKRSHSHFCSSDLFAAFYATVLNNQKTSLITNYSNVIWIIGKKTLLVITSMLVTFLIHFHHRVPPRQLAQSTKVPF